MTLVAVCCTGFADGPRLSLTKSNENVLLTWSQTNGNWLLYEVDDLDYSYVSNGVTYRVVHPRRNIPTALYSTNGSVVSIALPVDFSLTNRFYMLHTNNLPPPPVLSPP
jgi:hypothetical protein